MSAPWSDEWIQALADEVWNPDESYKAACCGFARAVAVKAMEEAATIADVKERSTTGGTDTGAIWRNAAYAAVASAIRARAHEIRDGR